MPEIECAIYGGMIGLHYGHTLLEFLPRLWYLRNTMGVNAKILVHCGPGLGTPWFRDLMKLAGISEDCLISPLSTTLVRHLLVPESCVQLNHYVMRSFLDFTNQMGDRISFDSNDQPVFLTKKNLPYGVVNWDNEAELCSELETYGFRIIAPEEHNLREQISFFRNSGGACGILGSNMHTSIFAREPFGLVLNIGLHISPSFYLLDRCNNADFRYVACDESHEVGAQKNFRRTFHISDPVALAAEFSREFFQKRDEVRSRKTARAPAVSEKTLFFRMTGQDGKRLCARLSDGRLISSMAAEADNQVCDMILQITDQNICSLFALSSVPLPVTTASTSQLAAFVPCVVTEETIGDTIRYGIRQPDSKRWLSLAPGAEDRDAFFGAEHFREWEYVTFIELTGSALVKARAMSLRLLEREMTEQVTTGGFMMM
ncbi:glycosyltransferase family 61 protein [Acetobacter fallax]|uniref:DUF563 domain-containing protein n=1 Tax=Acetobacter fallax TaxID=1737473 RepID=A0ABX0KC08_9PROT|nr:glycosyltransferase 61 family protein [Acetobacter fallax]NHO32398.1 DUF563 domain-containing protein [Acetobacter fallax]NHO35934.1 DUF563 domain-containing protein [Acetobacter fallax]